jgi:hypothetical protein
VELEAAIMGNTSVASRRFVLAYHFMVQDHLEAPRHQFEHVVKLEPKDDLAAPFAKMLATPSEPQTAPPTGAARDSEAADKHELSPPPEALLGNWKAKPMPDLSIELNLMKDGQFAWEVHSRGQVESIIGDADYADGVLKLAQPEAPGLVGEVVNLGEKWFEFDLLGGPQDATIQFSR